MGALAGAEVRDRLSCVNSKKTLRVRISHGISLFEAAALRTHLGGRR